MVTAGRVIEIAARLREEGAAAVADQLATAHEGVFNGTELAMKWRFYVAQARKLNTLSAPTRQEVEQVWRELQVALS
ncbi:hypothetical protein [Caulobacter sp. UNC279MFTsu5.1]|uniref:hypothetical protein n=1 Tax=Caulobacter sp. UNC279MFTsu5.1 TaxID=1502775 RepID=UPI00037D9A50|nr:hypothetical protein [Caulobacter sp. UNC279MFTsu5.1]